MNLIKLRWNIFQSFTNKFAKPPLPVMPVDETILGFLIAIDICLQLPQRTMVSDPYRPWSWLLEVSSGTTMSPWPRLWWSRWLWYSVGAAGAKVTTNKVHFRLVSCCESHHHFHLTGYLKKDCKYNRWLDGLSQSKKWYMAMNIKSKMFATILHNYI